MALPLSKLYSRVLTSASDAYDLPTIEESTQELVQSCQTDVKTVQDRISSLSLFSSNETLEDISTQDLIYLTVPYVAAEVQGRVCTTEREDRLVSLVKAQELYLSYVSSLENYGIVTESDTKLFGQLPANAANRRELKIKQYQHEKDLRTRVDVIRKRRKQKIDTDKTNDFILTRSLLPSSEDEDEDDEIVRETTILLLRLFYTLSQAQLKSIADELELLRTAPPPFPYIPPSDNEWKLESSATPHQGPLLSPTGQPLRPFTILPSGVTNDRARVAAGVFGPGHLLPSMSIDEYLEIERQRGNILSGGGPASENVPTSSEQLAIDAEMDGTIEGAASSERKRLKDENWSIYTDENPKGAGNTMNRG